MRHYQIYLLSFRDRNFVEAIDHRNFAFLYESMDQGYLISDSGGDGISVITVIAG